MYFPYYIYSPSSLLECEFHKSRNFCLLYLPRYSQRQKQCQHIKAAAPQIAEFVQPF